jgi:hypothetical protein
MVSGLLTPNGKVGRRAIDLDNPVLWQDVVDSDLSVYQAVMLVTEHFALQIPIQSRWFSWGSSLFRTHCAWPGKISSPPKQARFD